ncbi:MAG TPA: N-acetylmuramoyl-L-alanine amidase-like domain-containing protein [Xanthobacteraceae bacterium]|nr:N-acetylmuramoyl-L-alanine amidase-like domain-containing protein [Xanthobacteraceae bacterium]
MPQPITRRLVLQLMAGLPLAAAPAFARERPSIGRLIAQASALPTAAERMALISRGLLGVRYRANTLIGGPRRKEVFVTRDDAFDCVTFCEVVLAAALARDLPEFETVLRRIRYRHGEVRWDERNHYFADWTRRAVENNICRPVAMEPSATIEKTVNWRHLGKRQVSLTAVPRGTLIANKSLLASGDVIGFVSRRPNLDFYHTGLIAFGKGGEVMLRHASRSRGRVVDDRIDAFVAVNRVQYVTLVRPVETADAADRG